MTRDLKEVVAINESVARDVNEAIQRGQWPGEEDERARFRCECAHADCNVLLELTPREYDEVRRHSRRFFVAHGHEELKFERIVERAENYLVVEKLDDEAGDIAEATDPRA